MPFRRHPISIARQAGLVLCAHHQRIYLPGGVPREGGSGAEVLYKEPRSGFGKRLNLIVELILASGLNEQPKFARPDRQSDCPLERRRAGKHAGVGGRDLRSERDQPVAILADERERRSGSGGNPDSIK
jgi:hypothetical protein